MKTSLGLAAALAVLLLPPPAGPTADHASDPGPRRADSMPTSIPPAAGPVRTRDLATVMDTDRPELCLGAVAESWPPQCSGLPLRGWDWGAQQGIFEKSGDVRWGGFAVTGRFDGSTFTVTGAIPAALYDTVAPGAVAGARPGESHRRRARERRARAAGPARHPDHRAGVRSARRLGGARRRQPAGLGRLGVRRRQRPDRLGAGPDGGLSRPVMGRTAAGQPSPVSSVQADRVDAVAVAGRACRSRRGRRGRGASRSWRSAPRPASCPWVVSSMYSIVSLIGW